MISFQKPVGTIDPKNNAEWFNWKANAKKGSGPSFAAGHADQKEHVPINGATRSVGC